MPISKIVQNSVDTGVAGSGPSFRATMSSTQTISSNTYTKILFDTETFDTNSNFNTTNNRFTPTVAGYYQMDIGLQINTTVGRTYALIPLLYKNGSSYSFYEFDFIAAVNSNLTAVSISDVIYMNGTTDYLEAYFYQYDFTTVGSANISYGGNYNRFTGTLVRTA
jgi:hypothetical protein